LRPQRKQRRTIRLLNFGFLSDLAITDFFAILINNESVGTHSFHKGNKSSGKSKVRG
jgi:hypothetical protein